MKISYKTLQQYIPNIKSAEEVAEDLVMHTAEVEEVDYQAQSFENIVYGIIKTVEAHEDADSLRVCMVDVGDAEDLQIVCGGSNLEVGQAVAVAKIGAVVSWHGTETITMKKTAIRGVESFGMICASEEIGLLDEFPQKDEKEILDLSHIQAAAGTPLSELLGKDDAILEVDNKAINHRPDLFSHIGIAREVAAIAGEKLDYEYLHTDFADLPDLGITNEIPQEVNRYMGLKVQQVENVSSPDYIRQVLASAGVESKGLLIDVSNYSLYLYGQPIHCFDSDKLTGNITVRKAKQGEGFVALDDKKYELSPEDIVIADDTGVIALAGIIGGKDSAVSDGTKNIIIESAHFDQATVRKTGKRLGVRTDALNVFEKDIVPEMQDKGLSLVVDELQKHISSAKETAFSDLYAQKQENVTVPFDLGFINKLIGKQYTQNEVETLLINLGFVVKDNEIIVPFWRKDIAYKADIAEEIARIAGYNNIESTIPNINMGAVHQSPLYTAKLDIRNYLTTKGYFDIYSYSFVNAALQEKCQLVIDNLVPVKNPLSEEMTHLRGSHIPHLLGTLEKNKFDFPDARLFEIEKVFTLEDEKCTSEKYMFAGVVVSDADLVYYDLQDQLAKLFTHLGVTSYDFKRGKEHPKFAHGGRTAEVIIRGKSVGYIGEIHPRVAYNFDIEKRIGFFEIDLELLVAACYSIVKAQEISLFQSNKFDLNFVVDKTDIAAKLQAIIAKTDQKIIQKVELIDMYENEEKLPGKRSLTYKIYIQSMDGTLDDKVKAKLIGDITARAGKIGAELR